MRIEGELRESMGLRLGWELELEWRLVAARSKLPVRRPISELKKIELR